MNDINGIVERYLAANPNTDNSREIVKTLSIEFAISEAKARSILIKADVYISQPKKKSILDNREKCDLVKAADAFGLTADKWYEFTSTQAILFNTTQQIVMAALIEKGRFPERVGKIETDAETERRLEIAALSKDAYQKSLNNVKSHKTDFSFAERLDGKAGWFANPLWIVNTVVLVLTIALVFTAITYLIS